MKTNHDLVASLSRQESGQNLVEYSVVAALIGLSAVGALLGLSGNLNINFSSIVDTLTGAV